MLRALLEEKCADLLRPGDIAFVTAMAQDLEKGYMRGRYMIIFRNAGVQSKKVYARLYLQEKHIVLRMYFSQVTKHTQYIVGCLDFIRHVFLGEYGLCAIAAPRAAGIGRNTRSAACNTKGVTATPLNFMTQPWTKHPPIRGFSAISFPPRPQPQAPCAHWAFPNRMRRQAVEPI